MSKSWGDFCCKPTGEFGIRLHARRVVAEEVDAEIFEVAARRFNILKDALSRVALRSAEQTDAAVTLSETPLFHWLRRVGEKVSMPHLNFTVAGAKRFANSFKRWRYI